MKTFIFVAVALGLYHVGIGVMLIPQMRRWGANIGRNQPLPADPVEQMFLLKDMNRVGNLNQPGILSRIREVFRWRKTLLALMAVDRRLHRITN